MTLTSNEQSAIARTERGLSIAGTRITIYDVMDYLKAQYPPQLIHERLVLDDEQVSATIDVVLPY
jgi:uncharacterized protein (DUF433 family)